MMMHVCQRCQPAQPAILHPTPFTLIGPHHAFDVTNSARRRTAPSREELFSFLDAECTSAILRLGGLFGVLCAETCWWLVWAYITEYFLSLSLRCPLFALFIFSYR